MDFAHLKPLLNWIHLHAAWAEVITFLAAFSESIALIGIVIPGSVLLTGIGTLIGTHVLPLWPTIFAAVLGAILGDTFSYTLGYYYSDAIVKIWPFSRYPEWIIRGKAFFGEHGGKSVFIGRFCGPLRPITPVVAGMMHMPKNRFLIATSLSGLTWAPTYILPGIALGAASLSLSSQAITHGMLLLLMIIGVTWFVTWIIRSGGFILYHGLDRGLQWLWQHTQHPAFTPLHWLLRDPQSTKPYQQGMTFLAFFVMLGLFAFITYGITHANWITALNQPAYHFFRSLHTELLDGIMLTFTIFADKPVLAGVILVVFTLLLFQKRWWAAGHWLGVAGLTIVVTYLLKHSLHSARPPGNQVLRSLYSFPSGHLTLAVALGAFLFVLLDFAPTQKRQRKTFFLAILGFLAIMILTRLFLNVHWVSDILGSVVLGLACCCAGTLSYRRRLLSPLPKQHLIASGIIALFFAWLFVMVTQFQKQLYHYTAVWPEHTISATQWWRGDTLKTFPTYNNRFGKAQGTMNLAWAGNLSTIREQLRRQDWTTRHVKPLHNFLRHLTGKHYHEILPLAVPFYRDHHPVLEMSYAKNTAPRIVLLLWDTGRTLDNGLKIWYGHVAYYTPHTLFPRHEKTYPRLLPALRVLARQLPPGRRTWLSSPQTHSPAFLLVR